MKKLLIAFLLSLTCACTVAGAVACGGDDSSSSETSGVSSEVDNSSSIPSSSASSDSSSNSTETTLTVNFVEGDGYTFVTDIQDGQTFQSGEIATFSLDVSVFYTGYAVVHINGKAIAPNNDGVYNVEMTENIEVTVSGIQKEVSRMLGSGSFEDAFVVTRPVDLLYIAEQVNAGNPTYVTGAYILGDNIDCGGEELKVIGDLSTENSYFSGCFSCMTDSETGEMQRYTISNFVINSENANYVGLFGAVYADLSVQSSALFYGIQLDNFTINARISTDAQVDNRSISAGGLIGYGIGANVWLCDATNGAVNVYGDDSYFSFAGGLIGYQQAFYSPELNSYFPSEIVYSTADVDVRILRGMGLYAGGISGYLTTNYPYGATAFIHNSYATGNVSGALRSGGVAGGLGLYTSVSNSYAIGDISAKTTQSLSDPLVSDTQYCYAYAGGIVGYAENETIVNDSFFGGKTNASAASTGCAFTASAIAGGDTQGTATASAQKYVVNNCLGSIELNLYDKEFFNNQLSWGSYDWNFKKDEYPTIFYGSPSGTVTATMTVNYIVSNKNDVTITVNGSENFEADFFDTSMQSTNIYSPVGNYFQNGSLDMYLIADNNYLSYGYFFDEACTQKVPYAYVPQKNITLYVGFADPTPVLGTYQLVYKNSVNALEITFDEDGIATYSDGTTTQKAYYFYDGETITVQAARLARYYEGEIVIDEDDTTSLQDPYFDMNRYSYYDFTGKLTEDGLILYDGIYFTANAPLISKKGEFSTTEPFLFAGSWTKSATVNKTYTFDGMGNWTYEYKSYTYDGYGNNENTIERNEGTYTVDGNVLNLVGTGLTATINDDGFLVIKGNGKDEVYYAEGSFVGSWSANGVTVDLFGINAKGIGQAIVTYFDGTVYDLVYERSETNGYVVLYYPHDDFVKDALFGYFTYESAVNMLYATLPDPNNVLSGYSQMRLMILDDYDGEWICDADEFLNVEFRFDGNGLYNFLYGYTGMQGQLTLIENGKEITVSYTLDSMLQGKFTYNGRIYTMIYDEDTNTIKIETTYINDDNEMQTNIAELERKDSLANIEFIDLTGVKYTFDGRSNLSTGGKLTMDGEKEYAYFANKDGESWIVKEGENMVGTMLLTENCYTLTINGNATELYIANEFIGNWAVGGAYGLFEIGPTDLNDTIQATFLGHKVSVTQLDVNLLTFRYRDGNMPLTYYVFIIADNVLGYDVLVLSQYNNLYSGDYAICTKANALFGSFTRNDGEFIITFDGVSGGAYSNGIAALSRGGAHSTPYFYAIGDNDNVMMWSQESLGGKTLYYKLKKVDVNSEDVKADDVYVQKDENGNVIAAFRRIEVDALYMTEAKDVENSENVYFFDGEGKLYLGDEVAYEYEITSYNTDDTAYLKLTANGEEYFAVLNYKDSSNITLKISPWDEETTPEEDQTPTGDTEDQQ